MQARHWIVRTLCACSVACSLSIGAPLLGQQDWGARIRQADGAEKSNAFAFFGLGGELAAAPGREGIDALKAAWPGMMKTALKQQFVKAWQFENPPPFRTRYHAHALELFDMVFEENDPQIVSWVVDYVPKYSWRSFETTLGAREWVAEHKSETGVAAALAGMKAWAARLGEEATRAGAMNDLPAIGYPLRRNPKLIELAKELKLAGTIEKAIEDPGVTYSAIGFAYSMLAELDPAKYPKDGGEAFLAKYQDRLAAQEAADKAAEEARILKEFDVRTIDGDAKKRWVFHPPIGKTQPENGWGLLIVMPGGDGAIGFAPFVGGTIRAEAGEDYAVVQLVAPPIEGDGRNSIVWPRLGSKDARVDFTMEPIWRGAIAAVKKERVIDPSRVWVMGWSSGGPPSYLAAVEDDSEVRGAFVVMSVFREDEYPTIANAKGKSFYLLHSAQDFIKMSHPEQAKASLEAAGARVKLQTYEGGHGWQGDSMKRIGEAVKWLEGK